MNHYVQNVSIPLQHPQANSAEPSVIIYELPNNVRKCNCDTSRQFGRLSVRLWIFAILIFQCSLFGQNFETLVLQGSNLVHYWKDNSNTNNPWRSAAVVTSAATGPASLIQSNSGIIGNFEAVVLEGSNLVHYWKNTASGDNRWYSGGIITSEASGPGALIQSTFGAQGNLEVVVPEGSNLVHYWKDTSNGSNLWQRGEIITAHATGPASIIQSTFGAKGNFEVVALEGSMLVHYSKDTSNGSTPWRRLGVITTSALGPGAIIQGGFGGNFEVVALEPPFCGPSTAIVQSPTTLSCSGEDTLVHYWRNNSNYLTNSWQRGRIISSHATGAGSIIQSTFGLHGDFEVVVPEGSNLVHYWEDTSSGVWHFATVITPSASSPAPLIGSCFDYRCAIDLKHAHFDLQLGAAVSDYKLSPDGVHHSRDYQYGSVYSSFPGGTFVVYGAIGDRYAALGRERSALGYPRSDELDAPPTAEPGRYNNFDGGAIYWSSSTGQAHEILTTAPPPPPLLAPNIVTFSASPNNGYIAVGSSAVLGWQIDHCDSDCVVSLRGREGLGNVVLDIPRLGASTSWHVTPHFNTWYTLRATNGAGTTTSGEKEVKLYGTVSPGPRPFYFRMTNPGSVVTTCFTLVVYASDQSSAQRAAEQSNGGYTATLIDASQLLTACN